MSVLDRKVHDLGFFLRNTDRRYLVVSETTLQGRAQPMARAYWPIGESGLPFNVANLRSLLIAAKDALCEELEITPDEFDEMTDDELDNLGDVGEVWQPHPHVGGL